jgi:hypothetical protein
MKLPDGMASRDALLHHPITRRHGVPTDGYARHLEEARLKLRYSVSDRTLKNPHGQTRNFLRDREFFASNHVFNQKTRLRSAVARVVAISDSAASRISKSVSRENRDRLPC